MPAWLTKSVIYEINTATFSEAGDFAGVTARLGDLETLGVNLLWLMPIHPAGKRKSKPPYGSPYAVRDSTPSTPATERPRICMRSLTPPTPARCASSSTSWPTTPPGIPSSCNTPISINTTRKATSSRPTPTGPT
jgi:hypothetical protein